MGFRVVFKYIFISLYTTQCGLVQAAKWGRLIQTVKYLARTHRFSRFLERVREWSEVQFDSESERKERKIGKKLIVKWWTGAVRLHDTLPLLNYNRRLPERKPVHRARWPLAASKLEWHLALQILKWLRAAGVLKSGPTFSPLNTPIHIKFIHAIRTNLLAPGST